MSIFAKLLKIISRHHQKRQERQALHLLLVRKDIRLLRDAGLELTEGTGTPCQPLPQTKERRWAAPLIRLLPPSSRLRGVKDIVPSSSSNSPVPERRAAGSPPSPDYRGEGGRKAG